MEITEEDIAWMEECLSGMSLRRACLRRLDRIRKFIKCDGLPLKPVCAASPTAKN
jgi:hypothetical protein